MHGSKTDEKNIQLLKLLAQLRDHIDIHRIIGLRRRIWGRIFIFDIR
jgi:hypothetical protein